MRQILHLHLLALCTSVQTAPKTEFSVSIQSAKVELDSTEVPDFFIYVGTRVLEQGLPQFNKEQTLGCRENGVMCPWWQQQVPKAILFDRAHPILELQTDGETVHIQVDPKDLNALIWKDISFDRAETNGFFKYTSKDGHAGPAAIAMTQNGDFACSFSMSTPLAYLFIMLCRHYGQHNMRHLQIAIEEIQKNGWQDIEDHIDCKVGPAVERLLENIHVRACKFEKILRVRSKLLLQGSEAGRLVVVCVEQDNAILDVYGMLVQRQARKLQKMHNVLKLYDSDSGGAVVNFCRENPETAKELGLSNIFTAPIREKSSPLEKLQNVFLNASKAFVELGTDAADPIRTSMDNLRKAAETLAREISEGEGLAVYGLNDTTRQLSECDKVALMARGLTIGRAKSLHTDFDNTLKRENDDLLKEEKHFQAYRKRAEAIIGYNEFDLLAGLLMGDPETKGTKGYAAKPGIEDARLLEAVDRNTNSHRTIQAIRELKQKIDIFSGDKSFKRLLRWASMSAAKREIMKSRDFALFQEVMVAVEECKDSLMAFCRSDIGSIEPVNKEPLAKIIAEIRGTAKLPSCYGELYLNFDERQELLRAIEAGKPLTLQYLVDALKLAKPEDLNKELTFNDIMKKAEEACRALAIVELDQILGLAPVNKMFERGPAQHAVLLAEIKACIMGAFEPGGTSVADTVVLDFLAKLGPLDFDYGAMAPAALLAQPDIKEKILALSEKCGARFTGTNFDLSLLTTEDQTLLAKLALIMEKSGAGHSSIYEALCELVEEGLAKEKCKGTIKEIKQIEKDMAEMADPDQIRRRDLALESVRCFLDENLPLSRALYELVYEHSELRYPGKTEAWPELVTYHKNALASLKGAHNELSKCLKDDKITLNIAQIHAGITGIHAGITGIHAWAGAPIGLTPRTLPLSNLLNLIEKVRDAYTEVFSVLSPLKPSDHKESSDKSGVEYKMTPLPNGFHANFAFLEQSNPPTPPKITFTQTELRDRLDKIWEERKTALIYTTAFMGYCLRLSEQVADDLVKQIPHFHSLEAIVLKEEVSKTKSGILELINGKTDVAASQYLELLDWNRVARSNVDKKSPREVLDFLEEHVRTFEKGQFDNLKELLQKLSENPENDFAQKLIEQTRAEEVKLRNLEHLFKGAFEVGCFNPAEYDRAKLLLSEGLNYLKIVEYRDITKEKIELAEKLTKRTSLRYVGPFDSPRKTKNAKPVFNSFKDALVDFSRPVVAQAASAASSAGQVDTPTQSRTRNLLIAAKLFGSYAPSLAEAGFFDHNPNHEEIAKVVMQVVPTLERILQNPEVDLSAADLGARCQECLNHRLLSLYAKRYLGELERAGVNEGLVYELMRSLAEVERFSQPLLIASTRESLEQSLRSIRQAAQTDLKELLRNYYCGVAFIESRALPQDQVEDARREESVQIKEALKYLQAEANQISSEVSSRTEQMAKAKGEIWALWNQYEAKSGPLTQQFKNMLTMIMDNPHRSEYVEALENISTGRDVELLGIDSRYIPDLITFLKEDFKPILALLKSFCGDRGSLGERGRAVRQAIHCINIFRQAFEAHQGIPVGQLRAPVPVQQTDLLFEKMLNACKALRYSGAPKNLVTRFEEALQKRWALSESRRSSASSIDNLNADYKRNLADYKIKELNTTLQYELQIEYLRSGAPEIVAKKAADRHQPALPIREQRAFDELLSLPLDAAQSMVTARTPQQIEETLCTMRSFEQGFIFSLCGMSTELDFSVIQIAASINALLIEHTVPGSTDLNVTDLQRLSVFTDQQSQAFKTFIDQQQLDLLEFERQQRQDLSLSAGDRRLARQTFTDQQYQDLLAFEEPGLLAYKSWRNSWDTSATNLLRDSSDPLDRAVVHMVTFWADQIKGKLTVCTIQKESAAYNRACDTWNNNLKEIIPFFSPIKQILDAAGRSSELLAILSIRDLILSKLQDLYIEAYRNNNWQMVKEVNNVALRVKTDLHKPLSQMQLASFNIEAAEKERDAVLEMPCNPASYSATRMRAAAFWHSSSAFKECNFGALWSNAMHLREATKAYNKLNPNDKIPIFPEVEANPPEILWEFETWATSTGSHGAAMSKLKGCEYFKTALKAVEKFYASPKIGLLGTTWKAINGVVCTVNPSDAPGCRGMNEGTRGILSTLLLLCEKFTYIRDIEIRVIVDSKDSVLQNRKVAEILELVRVNWDSLRFGYDTVQGSESEALTNVTKSWKFSMSELIKTCIEGLGRFYQAFSYVKPEPVKSWAREFRLGEEARRCMMLKLQPAYTSMTPFCVERPYFAPAVYVKALTDKGKFKRIFTEEEAGELHKVFRLISGSKANPDPDIFSWTGKDLLSAPAKESLLSSPPSKDWFTQQPEIAQNWKNLFNNFERMTGPIDFDRSKEGMLQITPSTLGAKKQPKALSDDIDRSLAHFDLITQFDDVPTELAFTSPLLLQMAHDRAVAIAENLNTLSLNVDSFRDELEVVKGMTMQDYSMYFGHYPKKLIKLIDARQDLSDILATLRGQLPYDQTLNKMEKEFDPLFCGTTQKPGMPEKLRGILWGAENATSHDRDDIIRAALAYPSSNEEGVTKFEVQKGKEEPRTKWQHWYGENFTDDAVLDIVKEPTGTVTPTDQDMRKYLNKYYQFEQYPTKPTPREKRKEIKREDGTTDTYTYNANQAEIDQYEEEKKQADSCIEYVKQKLAGPETFTFAEMQSRLNALEGKNEVNAVFEGLKGLINRIKKAETVLSAQISVKMYSRPLDFSPAITTDSANSMSQIYSECDFSLYEQLHRFDVFPIELMLKLMLNQMSQEPWRLVLPANLNLEDKERNLRLSTLEDDEIEQVRALCNVDPLVTGNIARYIGTQEPKLPDSDIELSSNPSILLAQLHPFIVNNLDHPAVEFIRIGLLFAFETEAILYKWIEAMKLADSQLKPGSEWLGFMNSIDVTIVPTVMAIKEGQRNSRAFHRVLTAIFRVIEDYKVHGPGAQVVCRYLYTGLFGRFHDNGALPALEVNIQETEVAVIIRIRGARNTGIGIWSDSIRRLQSQRLEQIKDSCTTGLQDAVYMTEKERLERIRQAEMMAFSCLRGPRHPYVLFLSGESGISPIRADKLMPKAKEDLLLDQTITIGNILNDNPMNLLPGTLGLLGAYNLTNLDADFRDRLAVYCAKALADEIRDRLTDEAHKALLSRLILSLTNSLQASKRALLTTHLSTYTKKGGHIHAPTALGHNPLPVGIIAKILSFVMPEPCPAPKVSKFSKMPRFSDLEFAIEKKQGNVVFKWNLKALGPLFAKIECGHFLTTEEISITIADPFAPRHYRMKSVLTNSQDYTLKFECRTIGFGLWDFCKWTEISAIELPPHIRDFFASTGASSGYISITLPQKGWSCFKVPISSSFIPSLYGKENSPLVLRPTTKAEISTDPIIIVSDHEHAGRFLASSKGQLYFNCEASDGRRWEVLRERQPGGTKLYQTPKKPIAICPMLISIRHGSWEIGIIIDQNGVKINLPEEVLILGSEYIQELLSRVLYSCGPFKCEGWQQMVVLNFRDIIGSRFRAGIGKTSTKAIQKGLITIKLTRVSNRLQSHFVSFSGEAIEIHFPDGSLARYIDMSGKSQPKREDDFLEYWFICIANIFNGPETIVRTSLPYANQIRPVAQELCDDFTDYSEKAFTNVNPYQDGLFWGTLELIKTLAQTARGNSSPKVLWTSWLRPFISGGTQRSMYTWQAVIRSLGIPFLLYAKIGLRRQRIRSQFGRESSAGGEIVVGSSGTMELPLGNFVDPITKQRLHGYHPEINKAEGAKVLKKTGLLLDHELRHTVKTGNSELITIINEAANRSVLKYLVGELVVNVEKDIRFPLRSVVLLEMGQAISSPWEIYSSTLRHLPPDVAFIVGNEVTEGTCADLSPIRKALQELVKVQANATCYKVIVESDQIIILEVHTVNGMRLERQVQVRKQKAISESPTKSEIIFEWLELFAHLFLLVIVLSIIVALLYSNVSAAPSLLDPENVENVTRSFSDQIECEEVPMWAFDEDLTSLFKEEPNILFNSY